MENEIPRQVLNYFKVSDIEAISTAHTAGSKKVLSKGREDRTRITQIACGSLLPEEEIPVHKHPDMDEYFFFTKGSGRMKVRDQEFSLSEGVYIQVPANAEHNLICTGEALEFFYFGLQVYK